MPPITSLAMTMTNWLKTDTGEDLALRSVREQGDRMMTAVCWLLWIASVFFAALLYGEWMACLTVGTPLALLATLLGWKLRGRLASRIGIAIIFMALSGVLIDEAHGMIESHFSIFALLAFLLYYRDLRPILAAAATIAVHHLAICELQMHGWRVYVFPEAHACDMVWVHAAYVAAETAVLIYLGSAIRREAIETAAIAHFGQRLVETGVIDLRGSSDGSPRSKALDELLRAINGAVLQASTVADGMGGISGDVTEVAREILSAGQRQQEGSESAVRALVRMEAAAQQVTTHYNEVAEAALGSVEVVQSGGRRCDAPPVRSMHWSPRWSAYRSR